jgi:hypothetical protein
MNTCRLDALTPDTPLWVWDGTWLTAHLIETPLAPSTERVLVRFGHGISAPIAASRIVLRDPALHESDRPSADLSAMMYAESLLTALSPFSNQADSSAKFNSRDRPRSSARSQSRRFRRARSPSSL